jgi:hypothetical protein
LTLSKTTKLAYELKEVTAGVRGGRRSEGRSPEKLAGGRPPEVEARRREASHPEVESRRREVEEVVVGEYLEKVLSGGR